MTELRIFLATPLFALLLGATPACRSTAPAAREGDGKAVAARPNVLMIAIDDLNDWVGAFGGHPLAKTPNMDRLAARGTAFLNAHAQAPLCNPSRASLLTGLRPSTTGVYALSPWFRESASLRAHETLFQYFRRHGYRTLTTGKIFHDAYPPRQAQGDGSEVDVWGFKGSFAPRPPQRLVPGLEHALVDWGVYPERDEEQDDWKVADWAIDQLKHAPQEPFFLAVGFRHPHLPLYTSQKWFALYPDDDSVLPKVAEDDRDDTPRFSWYLHWKLPEPRLAWVRAQKQFRNKVRSYLASVSFVDHLVGRVLDALDQSGLAKDTIVVLWSDHGYHLGEKLITGKNTLWERSTRVPLIFAGPGVAAGARVRQPAELLDIYPTLVALAGLPVKDGLEGRSLTAQLEDAAAARTTPAITTHGPGNHAVRDERWRYIRYADGSEELYDSIADPNEWRNLAEDASYGEHKRRLAAFVPAGDHAPLPGSGARLIERKDEVPYWEGQAITEGAEVPGP